MLKGTQEYINLGGNPRDLFLRVDTKELNLLGEQVMSDTCTPQIVTQKATKEKLEASEFVSAFRTTLRHGFSIYLSENGETAAKMCGEQELIDKIMEE